jgi:glycosyltransferase involved in cell wall biosynthesis
MQTDWTALSQPTMIIAKLPITAIVAVRNEERNISRCLCSLSRAEAIYVIESSSKDTTTSIAANLGACIVQFCYAGGYPKKRQWALDTLNIATPWVMFLDADEVVPDALWDEISTAIASARCDAFLVTKGFHFMGRRFRFGGFSHSAVILFRRGLARFERLLANSPLSQDMEVHERIIVDGCVGHLRTPLIHEDFKGLEAYVDRHNTYSTWEALLRQQYWSTGAWGSDTVKPRLFGNSQEQRRWLKRLALRAPFEPQLWFLYHYFIRLGFLEGRPGLIASRLRANYVADVHAKAYELQKRPSVAEGDAARGQTL